MGRKRKKSKSSFTKFHEAWSSKYPIFHMEKKAKRLEKSLKNETFLSNSNVFYLFIYLFHHHLFIIEKETVVWTKTKWLELADSSHYFLKSFTNKWDRVTAEDHINTTVHEMHDNTQHCMGGKIPDLLHNSIHYWDFKHKMYTLVRIVY